jgi:osmotically-inducible protein OsmY
MKRFLPLIASLALAALMFGCGGDTTDNKTNTNTSNVTVNHNNNTNANANANANANRGAYNANISQEDYNKDKETFAQKAKDLGDKVGSSLTDGWLWAKTRGILVATSGVTSSGINVDVNNGVITLRGTVPSADEIKKVDAAVKSISGSKGVQNQLKVAAGGNANASAGNKNAPAKK